MDESQAHRHFSAGCFNEVWTYLDNPERTKKEDELMRECAHASLFHWLKRDDCTDQNLSIGYWILSRVYSVLQNGVEAKSYAELCLKVSGDLSPFCLGYAHEAFARAASVLGNEQDLSDHLAKAKTACDSVTDKQDQDLLSADLAELSI